MNEKVYLRLMLLAPLPIIFGMNLTSVAFIPYLIFALVMLSISAKMTLDQLKAAYRLLPIYFALPYLVYVHLFIRSMAEPLVAAVVFVTTVIIGYLIVGIVLVINSMMKRDKKNS